jgi:hypothetical protein
MFSLKIPKGFRLGSQYVSQVPITRESNNQCSLDDPGLSTTHLKVKLQNTLDVYIQRCSLMYNTNAIV